MTQISRRGFAKYKTKRKGKRVHAESEGGLVMREGTVLKQRTKERHKKSEEKQEKGYTYSCRVRC